MKEKVNRWLDLGTKGIWDGIDYIFWVGGVLRSKTVRMYTLSSYSIFQYLPNDIFWACTWKNILQLFGFISEQTAKSYFEIKFIGFLKKLCIKCILCIILWALWAFLLSI